MTIYRIRLTALIILSLLLAGCAPADNSLPTLVPTLTPSSLPPTETLPPSVVPPTSIPTITLTPRPSATFTPLPTITLTFTPSPTAVDTITPTPTVNVTAFAAASATAFTIERPVLVTLTPVPLGVVARPTSTGTPEVIADVVITEAQYQEELDRLLADADDITDAQVDFVAGRITVLLSARTRQAITSGSFAVFFDPSSQGFNNILTVYADNPEAFVMSDGGLPGEDFIAVAYEKVVPAVFEAFNTILNQRLGEGNHDLDSLVITNDSLQITLYVPIP